MGDPTDANSDGGVALIAVAAAIDITGIYCCDVQQKWSMDRGDLVQLATTLLSGTRSQACDLGITTASKKSSGDAYFARLSLLVRFALLVREGGALKPHESRWCAQKLVGQKIYMIKKPQPLKALPV